jgi:hypothetical protein
VVKEEHSEEEETSEEDVGGEEVEAKRDSGGGEGGERRGRRGRGRGRREECGEKGGVHIQMESGIGDWAGGSAEEAVVSHALPHRLLGLAQIADQVPGVHIVQVHRHTCQQRRAQQHQPTGRGEREHRCDDASTVVVAVLSTAVVSVAVGVGVGVGA